MKRSHSATVPLLALTLSWLAGCGDASAPPSSNKAITSYSLLVWGREIPGRIDEPGRRITLTVPGGTIVTSLLGFFTTTGASVKVGAVDQASGGTGNDFTSPVTYVVTAQDGTSVEYLVTVTRAPGAVALPATGQTLSFDSSSAARDDGAWRRGVTWPVPRMVRLTVLEADCVLDVLTGLMWPTVMSMETNWAGAFTLVGDRNAANLCGHSDWRLPNRNELATLIDASNQAGLLPGAPPCAYNGTWWSSTTSAATTGSAYTVDRAGGILVAGKTTGACVVPVRGTTSYATIPRTGQTTSFVAGDDGALQAGVAWPAPRFTVETATVTDALTGLTWTRNANLMPTRDAGWDRNGTFDDGLVTWQRALDYVAKLNAERYLGYDDWRLPNNNEGRSLFNASQSLQGTWLTAAEQGFTGVADRYWTSTTAPDLPGFAYGFYSSNGVVYFGEKMDVGAVWPVRGGP